MRGLLFSIALIGVLAASGAAQAFTASKVWYEFHPGFYRIQITYTVPELREVREACIDVRDPQEAAVFFWGLVRGGDFYLRNGKVIFTPAITGPRPW